MSLEELKSTDIAELSKLPDDDIDYVINRLKSSMTEEERWEAIGKLDTGIYDSDGNLIGDKCKEEDDYE